MKQFYILIFLAVVLLTAYIRFLWKTSFSAGRQKGNTKEESKRRLSTAGEKIKSIEPDLWRDYKKKTIKRMEYIPVVGLSKSKKVQLQNLIEAAGIDDWNAVTPEELHFNQTMYAGLYIFICVILSLKFPILLLGLLATYFIYRIPVISLSDKYNQAVQEIHFQFPDFYDTVYCQYIKKDNVLLLSDIVTAYAPIANASFKKLLKRFLIDLESGEEYALRQLDLRYSTSPVIHKFCSIMRLRLKGDEAAYLSMHVMRENLQSEVKEWMLNDLHKRETYGARITAVMITAILTVVLIIYFITFLGMGR